MKKSLALFLLTVIGCHSGPTYPWFSGTLDELRAITGSKPIMIEFYTDT